MGVTGCALQLATSVFGRKSKKRPLQGPSPSTKRQCLQPQETSFTVRNNNFTFTPPGTNNLGQLVTEFAFTVQDHLGNIREVYSPSKSLGDLKIAIGREFEIPSPAS